MNCLNISIKIFQTFLRQTDFLDHKINFDAFILQKHSYKVSKQSSSLFLTRSKRRKTPLRYTLLFLPVFGFPNYFLQLLRSEESRLGSVTSGRADPGKFGPGSIGRRIVFAGARNF